MSPEAPHDEEPNPAVIELLLEISSTRSDMLALFEGRTRTIGERELSDEEIDLLRSMTPADEAAITTIWQVGADYEAEVRAARDEFMGIAGPYMADTYCTVGEALSLMPAAERDRCDELLQIFGPYLLLHRPGSTD